MAPCLRHLQRAHQWPHVSSPADTSGAAAPAREHASAPCARLDMLRRTGPPCSLAALSPCTRPRSSLRHRRGSTRAAVCVVRSPQMACRRARPASAPPTA
eukprot:8911388-Alexandrium_andersonii.AAC.1